MAKRVLLTGIAGFIGSHCLQYWLDNSDYEILGLDSFRHKGYGSRIEEIKKQVGDKFYQRVKIYSHDLTVPIDPPLENLIMGRRLDDRGVVNEKPIDVIVNMASDSAVERSTSDPTHCLRNNFELEVNMLELARRIKPRMFVQVSTDEVYGEAPPLPSPGHKEWDAIMPSNPYAASKAAQEALAIAYWRTYDVPVIITNTMNIVAEMQDPEKFLPKIVQFVATGKEMPVYADKVGDDWKIGSRVYLDAKNKADAILFLMKHNVSRYSLGAKRPDRYNICGENELNNLELAQLVAKIMGKELNYKLIPSESARPGYDRRYALDGTKLRDMGWQAPIPFEETIQRIVSWTLKQQEWLV
jgi:dTDP-glucose 4,6-dehydratase